MPALFTHNTFIEKNTDQKDKYAKVRALGGQGPDVFFFYGYSLVKRKKKSQRRYFGTYLHHINIADAYSFLLEYAAKQEEREMLYAYLKGVLMHYVMDRNCHPYIFYRTGFATESDSKVEVDTYMNFHVKFEATLDTIYAKRNKTFKHPRRFIKCPKKQVKVISKMFYDLAKYLKYDDIDEFTFYTSYKDLVFVESILYSPLGIKKFFIHHSFLNNSFVDCMMSPNKTKPFEKYDILNLQNSVWKDCVTGVERTESFEDLVENCKKELKIVDILIEKASNKENIRDEMTKFINNIDHDGFEVNAKKLHYQNYLIPKDTK